MGPLFIVNSPSAQLQLQHQQQEQNGHSQSGEEHGSPVKHSHLHEHQNTYSQIHEPPPKQSNGSSSGNIKRHSNHPSSLLSSASTCDEFLTNDPTCYLHHRHHDHHTRTVMTNSSSNLRKHIVLLQDCVAIKFVPTAATAISSNSGRSSSSGTSEVTLPNQENNGVPQLAMITNVAVSELSDVDQSMHGMYLYKGFREANLKCYWNASLCEAIRSLEYKGYLIPFTILVFSSYPRHLEVLRTAWSRRILRNPIGFSIDLLGEVEEIVAQPLQQGQFAPLSDSLCWAIHELTSSGHEAFIDSIMQALASAFPTMSNPPKELVYHTLEKLIREQKIYQTSHGYYIVTPEINSFMNSRSATPAPMHNVALGSDWIGGGQPNRNDDFGKLSTSKHSWGSDISALDVECWSRSSQYVPHVSTLKRHGSLKIIRQRNRDSDVLPRPCMGARSLSFRLSKVNSLFDSDKEDFDDRENAEENSTRMSLYREREEPLMQNTVSAQPEVGLDVQNKDNSNKKKRRSFLRRWFSFRPKKPQETAAPISQTVSPQSRAVERPPATPPTQKPLASSSTQTQTISKSSENIIEILTQNATRICSPTSKWNSLPSANRHPQRKSIIHNFSYYDDGGARNIPQPSRSEETSPTTFQQQSSQCTNDNGRCRVKRAASPCPSSVSAIYASIPGAFDRPQDRVYPRVFQQYNKYVQQKKDQEQSYQHPNHPPPVMTRPRSQHHKPRPRSIHTTYTLQEKATTKSSKVVRESVGSRKPTELKKSAMTSMTTTATNHFDNFETTCAAPTPQENRKKHERKAKETAESALINVVSLNDDDLRESSDVSH